MAIIETYDTKPETQSNTNQISTEYYDIDLGHTVAKFRKWKVKDRKLFKQKLAESEGNAGKIIDATIESLIFNCIKTDRALTPDELQYLFVNIRSKSISDEITFNYDCSCGFNNKKIIKLKDITKLIKGSFKSSIEKFNIKLQPIKNSEFYYDILNKKSSDDVKLITLALMTESIDNKIMSFDETLEYYEDLDTDVLDEIIDEFNTIINRIDNNVVLKCDKCGKEQEFLFDEIPDFLPVEWLSK